jgi:D-alanyl-D-alanine carboxypeptidase
LLAGDTLTVRDLLYGLLVYSGNDAANALARHVGASLPAAGNGPVDRFVADMNRIVDELGLRNTHFANPSGIDQVKHYASALDLAILTARAMTNPTFAQIVATPSIVLPSQQRPDGYPLQTTNDLLLEGLVVGVKTGTTEDAGGCLIAASRVGQNLIISVILGSETQPTPQGGLQSPARFQDMRTILAAMAEDYLWLDLAAPDTLAGLAEELGVWDSTLPPGPALVVPAARRDELRYRLQLGPPGEPNAPIGKVLFFVGSDLLSERPVLQA